MSMATHLIGHCLVHSICNTEQQLPFKCQGWNDSVCLHCNLNVYPAAFANYYQTD